MAKQQKELPPISEELAILSKKVDALGFAVKSVHGNTKPALSWIPSIAAAVILVLPVQAAIHKYAGYFPMTAVASGALKDFQAVTHNWALSKGIKAMGGDVLFHPPLSGKLQVTSGFGMRKHPVLGTRKHHNGTDYACKNGEPVKAVLNGIVVQSGISGASGNLVIIAHSNGFRSAYAHLDKIKRHRHDKVSTGEVIGTCGSTGRSTGPHLHLGIINPQDKHIDPAQVIGLAKATGMWQFFKDTVAASESRGAGNYQAVNPYTKFIGRYQQGTMSLCDAKLLTEQACKSTRNKVLFTESSWRIPGGYKAFLNNPDLQEKAYLKWQRVNVITGRKGIQKDKDTFIRPVVYDHMPAYKLAGFLHAAQFGIVPAMEYYSQGKDSKIGRNPKTSVYAKRGEKAFIAKYGRFAPASQLLATFD